MSLKTIKTGNNDLFLLTASKWNQNKTETFVKAVVIHRERTSKDDSKLRINWNE